MRHLKSFNESLEDRVSILNPNWVKLLPKSLVIFTNNGEFKLERDNNLDKNTNYPEQIYNLMTSVSIPYGQNTMAENGNDPLADGEPDTLQFDIYIVKNNKGYSDNPDLLRLNIDLTYGDQMQCEFTIEKLEDGSTKVGVHHYTGKNSLYDPDSYWSFSDESILELVRFFNRFGFNLKPEDFNFIDCHNNSYRYDKPVIKDKEIVKMSGANKEDVLKLKGGDKILRYEDMDDYKIDLEPDKN